jgi:hypothetical protein
MKDPTNETTARLAQSEVSRLPVAPPTDEFRASRDTSTARGLTEIDGDLAGLFMIGRRLAAQPDEPGLVYLIAHAGRELSLTVVRELEEETGNGKGEESEGEHFRERLASAIQLPPSHPIVSRWFKAHQRLVRSAHVRIPAPQTRPVRAAFTELSDLLYGRTGPYFETQAELDALADRTKPEPEDLDRVRRLLLRPAQRRRFFGRLTSADWLVPLMDAGLFEHPPERRVYADGSWRAQDWPEGAYLVRMAPVAPKRVADILAKIPRTIMNPVIWSVVADAIAALPPDEGVALVPSLVAGLKVSPPRLFSHDALKALNEIAQAGRRESFELFAALTWLRRIPEVPRRDSNESASEYAKRLRDQRYQITATDSWVLARLERYDVPELARQVYPALAAIDAKRLIETLADQLQRAAGMVAALAGRLTAIIGATERGETAPDEGESENNLLDLGEYGADESRYWCSALSHVHDHDGVREHLAVALLTFALQYATDGQRAESVLEVFEQHRGDIFQRLSLAVLARIPLSTDALRARVDAFVSSPEALEPPYAARESAELLRAHFPSASEEAQTAFLRGVETGPADDDIASFLAFMQEEDTPAAREEHRAQWQRVRLRWFHDHIPNVLQPLAARLGFVAAVPDAQQQSLDETGSWSSGVSSVGPRRPRTATDLAGLNARELLDFLLSWRPSQGGDDSFDLPSEEGLASVLGSVLRDAPAKAIALLPHLATRPIALRYLSTVLSSLKTSLASKPEMQLGDIVRLAEHAWSRASASSSEGSKADRWMRWTATAACDLVQAAVDAELATGPADAKVLWRFANSVIDSPLTTSDDARQKVPTTFAHARALGSSMIPGHAIDLVMTIAWWDFRRLYPNAKWPPPDPSEINNRLVSCLDRALAWTGLNAISSQAALGPWLPHLLWSASSWTRSRLPELLDGGIQHPSQHPAWAAYVRRDRLLDVVFQIIRPWYAATASALSTNGGGLPEDDRDETTEAFTIHVITGVVRGLCNAGDADALVENTFRFARMDKRTHAYWAVYRGWSDSAAEPHPPLARNIIRFWSWRLEELEGSDRSEAREEEADGLCWFIATPHLPATDVVSLGLRTVRLLGSKHNTVESAWDRLSALAGADPAGVFEIAAHVIELHLADDHVYLPYEDVAPSLRHAIRSGGSLRDRAISLLHRLGERGHPEYADLWREGLEIDESDSH